MCTKEHNVCAKKLLAKCETLILSEKDWKHFMDTIDKVDKQRRPKLEAAAQQYLKKYQSVDRHVD